MRFGAYTHEIGTFDDDADVWALIDRAVKQAAEDDCLDELRVGPMVDADVRELFDEEDVIALSDACELSAERIRQLVSERHGEKVHDGIATMDDAAAKPALRRVVQAHRSAEEAASAVVAWACEYISLDPAASCHGRSPLPIEFVDGEWIFGDEDAEPNEPSACITYAINPSPETGDVGWCWWALGRMGDAPTLREAMAKATETIQRVIDDRMAVL